MLFWLVSGVGLGMGVLDFGGDRRRGSGSFGGEFAASHCNQGEFVASLCGSAYSDRAVVWRGEWGGHSCIRWKSTCLKRKGLFLAWFLAFFGICARIRLNGRNGVLIAEKCIRLVCEKLTAFPYGQCIVEFCVQLAFW